MPMVHAARPVHVSLLAVPEAAISTLSGIYDVMNAFRIMEPLSPSPFQVEIVGETAGPLQLASGVPTHVQRGIDEVVATDIVIAPSVLLPPEGWVKGRYPALLEWLAARHRRGALLCSACSGVFLLAETGLFDNNPVTVHFGYARTFATAYPAIPMHPERVLVISGRREELITSGASMSWHDLVLYLIARHAGVAAAQAVGRFFALQWHQDGLAPYIVFDGRNDHGDVDIQAAQEWLSQNFAVSSPVEEMIKRSRLPERTFKRRFTNATGYAPIAYIQRLRIEDAKRRLERTEAPIDEISWQVGYEEAAFFRRLFKRMTGLTPGAYRRRFRLPDFARSRLP